MPPKATRLVGVARYPPEKPDRFSSDVNAASVAFFKKVRRLKAFLLSPCSTSGSIVAHRSHLGLVFHSYGDDAGGVRDLGFGVWGSAEDVCVAEFFSATPDPQIRPPACIVTVFVKCTTQQGSLRSKVEQVRELYKNLMAIGQQASGS